MQIRGLTLPTEFVNCIETGVLRRDRGSWPLRYGRDAYGSPWEAELGEVYETIDKIKQESNLLASDFPPGVADLPEMFSNAPGFIPYILDFSQILVFAIAGDGSPYCFDYRQQIVEPSIIWWDDAYWRRVSPTFSKFVGLFDLKRNPQ